MTLSFKRKGTPPTRRCACVLPPPVPRHPARSAAGSPAAFGCSPAPLPPQKQRRHLEHALQLCRGILHAQQQAAQQHLGVRRLHLHLRAKTTFRTGCAAASCTLRSRQPRSIWVFAGSTSTSRQRRHLEHALRLCRGILHITLSSRQPSSIWVFAGSTSTSKQRRHLEHALRLCREGFRVWSLLELDLKTDPVGTKLIQFSVHFVFVPTFYGLRYTIILKVF